MLSPTPTLNKEFIIIIIYYYYNVDKSSMAKFVRSIFVSLKVGMMKVLPEKKGVTSGNYARNLVHRSFHQINITVKNIKQLFQQTGK